MAFDGSTISTAETGTFSGGSISETFTLAGNDVDMLAVRFEAGRAYSIDVDSAGSPFDPVLRIFDQFGNEVMRNDDGTDAGGADATNPYVWFSAAFTGTYYLSFGSIALPEYDPFTMDNRTLTGGNPGPQTTFTLTVTDLNTEEWPEADTALAATGVFDESVMFDDDDRRIRVEYADPQAIDDPKDVDFGRIDLRKGDRVVIDVNGALPGQAVLDAHINVFRGLTGPVVGDTGSGQGGDAELSFTAAADTAYFVAISGKGNSVYLPDSTAGRQDGDTGVYTVIIHLNPTHLGTSSGADSMTGGKRDDYLVLLNGNDTGLGGRGDDTVAGGDGRDLALGGDGDDALFGELGNDTLNGEAGNDALSGGLGNDSLLGDAGTDILQGGDGNDTLLGADDADTLYGDAGDDRLFGGLGDDSAEGGDGSDSIVGGAGEETMTGGAGADTLNGDAGSDWLAGGLDADLLNGGADNDTLTGEIGSDTLQGGGGNDVLNGGLNNDTLTGGGGNDVFIFANMIGGVDIITDFDAASATERIDLSIILAGQDVTAANLSNYIQCTPVGAGADSFLAVDADGLTGGLDFTIVAQVNGVAFSALFDIGNFVL